MPIARTRGKARPARAVCGPAEVARAKTAFAGVQAVYRPRICTSIGPSVTLMTLSGPWPVEPSTSWTVTLEVIRLTGPGGVGVGLLLYRTLYAAPAAFNAPSTITSTFCP